MVPISPTLVALASLLPLGTLANSISGLSLAQPLSQQFPPVARVDQPFSWTFSSTTFASTSIDLDDLSYTAFNLPPWLAFSGTARTFTGNPTEDDLGNRVVQLTATTSDGQSTISDHVVLTVSDKSGNITLLHPVADQLNAPDSGSITSAYPYSSASTHYPGVRVPPNWSFSLGFTPSTFTAPSRVFYSASMKDGSALPGWLGFNNQTVTFDGVTPPVPSGSTYEVLLSGSDVWGYSDIQQSFSIVVAAHDLQLVRQPVVNMTVGYSTDTSLKSLIRQSLSLDGEQGKVDMSDLSSIELDTTSTSWLTYYADNTSISGAPPPNQGSTTTLLPLRIADNYGDSLDTTLQLAFYPSLFNNDRPDSINLEIGKQGSISMDQYLSNASKNPTNITASFDPKEASSWLSFSTDQKTLMGTPPADVKYDQVTVTLRAQDLVTNAWSRSVLTLALQSNGTTLAHIRPHRMHGLGKGTKVALGIVCSLVAVLIFLFAMLALRRRRTASHRIRREVEEAPEGDSEGKWSYEAAETPALEYTEKMGDPATAQMLVLGRIDGGSSETVIAPVPHLRMGSGGSTTSRLKQSFLSNPFGKGNKKVFPKISNPIIMPSLSNAAFQAQLAAAVDSAGIVNRGNSTYSARSELTQTSADDSADFTATPSFVSGSQIDRSQAGSKASQRSSMTGARTTITDDSAFGPGQSSRASWESEPPFVWTIADTPHEAHASREGSLRSTSSPSSSTHDGRGNSASSSSSHRDSNAPTQRADFKITNIPMPPSRAPSPHGSMVTADLTDEGISIDNIHFPTDSDLAHTEASSNSNSKDDLHAVAIIQTASRVDARRTLDSPATASLASSHTERGAPSPVMTTHSRLVSFGKQRQVEVEEGRGSISHSAVVEAGSRSGSIGLGIMSTPPQRAAVSHSPPPESPLPQPPRAMTRPRAPIPPSRSPTPPSSLPSLPALPTLPTGTSTASRKTRTRAASPLASPQRILLGVSEPFHFYPPLSISPSTSSSSTSSGSTSGRINRSAGAEYLAFVEKKGTTGGKEIRLGMLPDWLHFEDGELWGVPTEEDRGEVDLRIVERRGGDERVVGRFSLEVS
ncbi:hypothetical protein I316_02660 [Kwoniella heveanensis BCC8398]|uniref:Dystroglycan-type cadherin-like domain-containing protein n=1 Tax=Kwoniella heveanensis BCC8398 TaxID=1296120 RepID=A0A1B9GXC5_9TREE|nr:hypothetical protein I316_02660 [Kwoniella heveanensis BCC8398]